MKTCHVTTRTTYELTNFFTSDFDREQPQNNFYLTETSRFGQKRSTFRICSTTYEKVTIVLKRQLLHGVQILILVPAVTLSSDSINDKLTQVIHPVSIPHRQQHGSTLLTSGIHSLSSSSTSSVSQ